MKNLEDKAFAISNSIGSVPSLLGHSIFFAAVLTSPLFGVDLEKALLVLTTVVSLEAIYLAIFIQMSVNKNTKAIENVEKDIDEIQEDVEEIQEDMEEIQEDVEEIAEDIDGIEKDIDEIEKDMDSIEKDIDEIQEDVEEIQEEILEEETEIKK